MRARDVSTDQLLSPVVTCPATAASDRAWNGVLRIEQIERLSPKPKQQLLPLIDTFIEAEALKQPNGAR